MEPAVTCGTTVTPETEAGWLAERRNSVGASEAASAAGIAPAPWPTPVELWQRKLGKAPEAVETRRMRLGKALEPFLAAEYEAETGARVERQQVFVRHPEHPWMTATLDGITADGRVVEFKTAAYGKGWGEAADDVPDHYFVQVQHQLACCGADAADLAVLIGGEDFRVYTVPRNDDLIAALVGHCGRFWRCVETRTPPDWGRQTPADLAALHPDCSGEVTLDAATAYRALAAEKLRERIAAYEAELEAHKMAVLAAMGDAQYAALPDGRKVKRFLQRVAENTRQVTTGAHVRHYYRILKGVQ